jgi:hypothetical protein
MDPCLDDREVPILDKGHKASRMIVVRVATNQMVDIRRAFRCIVGSFFQEFLDLLDVRLSATIDQYVRRHAVLPMTDVDRIRIAKVLKEDLKSVVAHGCGGVDFSDASTSA